jgi:hypothetical protein
MLKHDPFDRARRALLGVAGARAFSAAPGRTQERRAARLGATAQGA